MTLTMDFLPSIAAAARYYNLNALKKGSPKVTVSAPTRGSLQLKRRFFARILTIWVQLMCRFTILHPKGYRIHPIPRAGA